MKNWLKSQIETLILGLILISSNVVFAYENQSAVFQNLVKNYSEIKEKKLDIDPNRLSESDVSKFQGKNSQDAASAAADKILQTYINQTNMKETQFGRTLQVLNDGYRSGVEIKQSKVKHKFDLALLAFQSSAQIDYQGFFNASLVYQSYDYENYSSDLRISEKVFGDTEVIINYLTKPTDSTAGLNLKWNW